MPIQQLNSALLAAMKAGQNTPFMQRYALLNPAVEEAFDLNAALRGAVGFSWDSLSADQKAELAMAFRRYTISNYTANFDSYEGQSFRVLPQVRRLPNGDVVVRTQIIRTAKSPVEIDYVVRQTPQGWKAVDVLTDGHDQPGRRAAVRFRRIAGKRRCACFAGRFGAESSQPVRH